MTLFHPVSDHSSHDVSEDSIMTVDNTPIPPNKQTQSQVTHEQHLKRIAEVTGITDRKIIQEAIVACSKNGRADCNEVINFLITRYDGSKIERDSREKEIGKSRSNVERATLLQQSQKHSTASQAGLHQNQLNSGKAVIDLTQDDDNDIQRAIAASLQDQTPGILGGQVSREDQEISRVLEASLMEESKSAAQRKTSDIWFVDPLNPHERTRKPGWPVGLKNVGNTCWFSAVIQSLFTVPRFRKLVLNYELPKDREGDDAKVKRTHLFMQELRRLFALMVASRKKYVDPSRAVEILKQSFTTTNGIVDNQQDVSEFQHKLLEWLEDALKSENKCDNGNNDVAHTSNNPMADLFYGQYLAEGTNEGKRFSNSETFGQFPLQVNGFAHIHDSLDAATVAGDIETLTCDATLKSRQELWFTRLPTVLTFELSRFQFNQQVGRPEKIHNRLHFPQVLYMDRYMEANKDTTRVRRDQVKKLNDELMVLKSRLEKFTQYGSSPKRMPIQDVLHYALDFAQTKPHNAPSLRETSTLSEMKESVEPTAPGALSVSPTTLTSTPAPVPLSPATPTSGPSPATDQSPMSVDSPSQSLADSMSQSATSICSSNHGTIRSPTDAACGQSETSGMQSQSGRLPTSSRPPIMAPAPRHVTSQELAVLQECLQRWRNEVETDVKELQESIAELEMKIGGMFSDPDMIKFAYRLHAVLVHEGQAASGHYWAYVYNRQQDKWHKYNDITVTDSSWEEVQRESVGGNHNTSAYCLMYMAEQTALTQQTDDREIVDESQLPNQLREFVREDNLRFDKEIQDWDDKQRVTAEAAAAMATAIDSKRINTETEKTAAEPATSPNLVALAALHSQISFKSTLQVFHAALASEKFRNNPEAALIDAASMEWKHKEQQAADCVKSLPRIDTRLQHILVYTFVNRSAYCNANLPDGVTAFRNVLYWLLYEQFTHLNALEKHENAHRLKEAAIKHLENIKKKATTVEKRLYQRVHEDYYVFRTVILCLVHGLAALVQDDYQNTVRYLQNALLCNHRLLRDSGLNAAMDGRVIAYYLRHTIVGLNDAAASSFETDKDTLDAFNTMSAIVVPSLPALLNSKFENDVDAAEQIRAKWCQFLGQEIADATKREHLQDLLASLFEPPTDNRHEYTIFASVKPKNIPDLDVKYTELLDQLDNVGEIAAYR